MKQTYRVLVVTKIEHVYTVEAESQDLAEEEAADKARQEHASTSDAYVETARAL